MTPLPLELRTDADYLSFLTEKYGWQIQGPFHTSAPQPLPRYVQTHEADIEALQKFLLSTYVIRDQFDTDHAQRRIFLKNLPQENPPLQRWIDEHNKLRVTNINLVTQALWLIHKDLQKEFPLLYEQLTPLAQIQFDTRGYEKMPFDEKVAVVRKLDADTYGFLEELEK